MAARPAAAGAAPKSDPLLDEQLRNVFNDDFTLMPLQREAIEELVKDPRRIYADDMGIGKTVVGLATIGVLAQRSRDTHFRALIGLYNNPLIDNWIKEVNKFVRPGFFTIQVLKKNTEPLLKAKRLLVFTTYARMRNTFTQALACLPEGCIPVATKRGKTACAPIIISSEADEPMEDAGPSLLDAMLAEHGLGIDDDETTPAAAAGSKRKARSEKRTNDNVTNFEKHLMDTLHARRALFSQSDYWRTRVCENSWLPSAPLLAGPPDDDRPPMFCVSWNCILFDEAHELKDIKTLQANAAMFLHYLDMMLWQTGTPIQNKLMDALSGLLMIRDSVVACELGIMRDREGKELKGTAAQEARILKSLQRLAFRRSTADLIRNAPEKIASDSRTSYMINTRIRRGVFSKYFQSEKEKQLHIHYVRKLRKVAERFLLSNKDKKMGILPAAAVKKKVAKDGDDNVEEDSDDSLLKAYTRALQVCAAAEVITEEGEEIEKCEEFGIGSTKMKMLLDILTNEIPPGEKVLVFDHRVKVLRVAMRLLLTKRINSVLFASEIAEGTRQAGVARWRQTGSGTDVLLCQTKMSGTGHTMVEAKFVIHLSPPLNPAVEDQANFRAWRPGQTSDVKVYILVVANSIEEMSLETQTNKRLDNKAYMAGAEVATRTKERIKLNAEDVLRHADAILGGLAGEASTSTDPRNSTPAGAGARNAPVYRERNTFEEESHLDHMRKLFHGPQWVTEDMMKQGKVYFLDPAKSYSDVNFLPRGSLIMTVSSSAHAHARELSHCAERQRLRYEATNPTASTFTGKSLPKKARVQESGKPTVPAQDSVPRNVRVALCPVSLYVLLSDEFFGELERLGRLYLEKRNAQAKVAGRMPAAASAFQRPFTTAHNNSFFPASAPPVVNPHSLLDPDRRGEAYTALTKLLGNAALRHQATYDLENLNTPAEISSALREFFQPQFGVIRSIDKQLQRSKHLEDAYHFRSQPNGRIELKGSVAAMLTDPVPGAFRSFRLDVDVLLSFAPLWHRPGYQLAERLAHPATPRKDAVDLYDIANESLRKKLHWVCTDQFGSEKIDKDTILINRSDFAATTMRDVLLPLVHEAGAPGSSAHVRAMATAALCIFALSGCDLTRIYLVACGDRDKNGAGAIQGLFVCVRVNRNTLIGPGIYLRSPNDEYTRQIFTGIIGHLFRDPIMTNIVNGQERLVPMEYDRSWCRSPPAQRGQPPMDPTSHGCLAWGHYAIDYQNFYREVPATTC